MTRNSFDRAAIALGIASIASIVFAIEDLGVFRFIVINRVGIAVALGLGGLAVVAGLTAWRALAVLTGLGFAAAAILQLISTADDINWIGGTLGTMSFWLGLAIGLILVGAAPRAPAADGSE